MAAILGKGWSDIQNSPHESRQERKTAERVPPDQESKGLLGRRIVKCNGSPRFPETEDHVQVREGRDVQGAAPETPEMRVQALSLS